MIAVRLWLFAGRCCAAVAGVVGLLEILLQHVRVGRFDAFVVVLLGFHNLEVELLVELNGALVVHLHVPAHKSEMVSNEIPTKPCFSAATHSQKDAIEVAIILDNLQDVIDHHRTDAEPTVRRQAAQRHNVHAPQIVAGLDATAHRADDDVIVVRQLGHLARFQHVNVEFVIVRDGKDDRVQRLQLLDVMLRHIAQFDAGPGKGRARVTQTESI